MGRRVVLDLNHENIVTLDLEILKYQSSSGRKLPRGRVINTILEDSIINGNLSKIIQKCMQK